ncbi:MAG: hypothetical protein ACHQYP_05915 [Nitrospiria bacterium]
MEIKITIPGSVVSKKNSKIATVVGGVHKPRRAIILPSTAYKKWENHARANLWGTIGFVFNEPIHVEAIFFYKGNRPDLSGACESIGDMGEGILWENDRLIESWDGSRMIHNLKNPRTELTIRDFEIENIYN